jgi:hypothetical protein
MRPNYENFIAECPYCKKENIFNRASDLETFEPIAFKEVICFECKSKFNINMDLINEKHEYLIFDCYELLKLKRYIYCIINLCQACEAFFLKGIETKLLLEPWKEKVFERHFNVFNSLSAKLNEKIKNYCYSKLLNIFFDLYINNKSFHSQEKIEEYINKVDCFAERAPSDEDIKKYPNTEIVELFLNCKKLEINKTRNDVVHKYAFRPGVDIVKKQLEEVRAVVFGLQTKLHILHRIIYIN